VSRGRSALRLVVDQHLGTRIDCLRHGNCVTLAPVAALLNRRKSRRSLPSGANTRSRRHPGRRRPFTGPRRQTGFLCRLLVEPHVLLEHIRIVPALVGRAARVPGLGLNLVLVFELHHCCRFSRHILPHTRTVDLQRSRRHLEPDRCCSAQSRTEAPSASECSAPGSSRCRRCCHRRSMTGVPVSNRAVVV
jgi:hypothetical protein